MMSSALSPYAKGRKHMWLMLASASAVIWGVPSILSLLDLSFDTVMAITLPFMGVLLVLGLRSLFIKSPSCGRSLFMRDWLGITITTVWPARECGKCGRDLTGS